MIENKPTYDIASDLIGNHVQPLYSGALAQLFESRDENGRLLHLAEDHIAGKYLILIFLNILDEQLSVKTLKSFSLRKNEFLQKGITVLAISSSSSAIVNSSLREQSNFCWPILSDAGGSIFAKYGLHKNHGISSRIVVLTPLRQIRTWYDSPLNLTKILEAIMEQATPTQKADNQMWEIAHAPVLVIPNVFTPAECDQLVNSYETGGKFNVFLPGPNDIKFDYKMPVYEHNRQDRVDHIIKDPTILSFIDQRIAARINPAIKKAFAFDVRRREEFHIARYVGERGGNKMGHRDNTSPSTAYRKFALSVNLNDDFEGGEVVFNEYNSHGYKGKPGTALVFSSSLLHEVLETTKGVRYNLISHLFDNSTAPAPNKLNK